MDQNFTVNQEVSQENFGRFVIEPLQSGYGHTFGNSLRRVLLSSLPGGAVTTVKVEGVKHQFSTLSGLKEDIVELILNFKKIRVKTFGDDPVEVVLKAKGPKEVTAADIEPNSQIEIANPDLYLGSLAAGAKLKVNLVIEPGFGYSPFEDRKTSEIGVIPVDALFSPVTRVNYKVEATRVGRRTDLDKLVMEIWTDGTVKPDEALKKAARILADNFTRIFEPDKAGRKREKAESRQGSLSEETAKITIEELEIPTRIVNSLKNGGVETIGQLMSKQRRELLKIKNLGHKSLELVFNMVRERGVEIADD